MKGEQICDCSPDPIAPETPGFFEDGVVEIGQSASLCLFQRQGSGS